MRLTGQMRLTLTGIESQPLATKRFPGQVVVGTRVLHLKSFFFPECIQATLLACLMLQHLEKSGALGASIVRARSEFLCE